MSLPLRNSRSIAMALLVFFAYVLWQRHVTGGEWEDLRQSARVVSIADNAFVRVQETQPTTAQAPLTIVLEGDAGEGVAAWSWVQEELSKTYRVISYDRLGTGLSSQLHQPLATLDERIEQLANILATLKAPRVVLVGHGIGNGLIQAYEQRFPDQVAALAFIDPTLLAVLPATDNPATQDLQARRRKFEKRYLFSNFGLGAFEPIAIPTGWTMNWQNEMRLLVKYVPHIFAVKSELAVWEPFAQKLSHMPRPIQKPLAIISSVDAQDSQKQMYLQWHETVSGYSAKSLHTYVEGATRELLLADRAYAEQLAARIQDFMATWQRE